MASKLTAAAAKAAKPKDKEYLLADGRQGLYLRVLPSGKKTWIFKYKFNGNARKLTLGQFKDMSLAEARDEHDIKRLIVRRGQDPTEPPALKPEELTVVSLMDVYSGYSKNNKAKSTSALEKWGLEKYVGPSIGNRLVKDIKRADAIKVIEGIDKGGMAAQVLKYSRSMFQYALDRDLVEYNPFSAIAKAVPSVKSKNRTRALSDDEIQVLWHSLSSITDPRSLETRRALLLILITGQRPEEVTHMHGREIQIGVNKPRCQMCRGCGWWTIPWQRIKTRNKREEDHKVFLSRIALEIMGDFKGFVFNGPKNNGKPLQRQALSHFVSDHRHFSLPHWTPNDLRRTAATGLSRLDCPDEKIDAILNHIKKGVISIYNQNKYKNDKQLWLTLWAEHLKTVINSEVGSSD
jgi:integrase